MAFRADSWIFVISLGVMALAGGCGDDAKRSRGGGGGGDEGGGGQQGGIQVAEKVDLLLVVDNSRGIGEKQDLLASQIAQWLAALQEAGAKDIHAGVVTSSLGGLGADSCAGQTDASENDRGRLISRQTTGVTPGVVPTYEGLGYLVWDPMGTHSPAGEPELWMTGESLTMLVAGAGDVGCGFETPLEAMYRFLVDPDPYATIDASSGMVVASGTDTVILSQRASFLRPDSLLVVVVLSDEDDCSTRAEGTAFLSRQIYAPGTTQQYHLPKARPECASAPHDLCCRSCSDPAPECPDASSHCDANGDAVPDPLSNLDDAINVRCFDQKRRFGVDFLYPIDRYVEGLTAAQIADRNGNVLDNPLFAPFDGVGGLKLRRHPSLVLLTAIVGVPWQDIARRNSDGLPDLLDGCADDCSPENMVGGIQSPSEMSKNETWDLVLGDPSCYHSDASCLPDDPLMIASIYPRSGTHPLLGEAVTTSTHGNSVNGNEMQVPARDDLQFACIFPLAIPRDCSTAGANEPCECKGIAPDGLHENPLCWNGFSFTNLQTFGGAKPGLRHLQLVRQLGDRGILGSICPAQQSDPYLSSFGYQPTLLTLMEAVRLRLR